MHETTPNGAGQLGLSSPKDRATAPQEKPVDEADGTSVDGPASRRISEVASPADDALMTTPSGRIGRATGGRSALGRPPPLDNSTGSSKPTSVGSTGGSLASSSGSSNVFAGIATGETDSLDTEHSRASPARSLTGLPETESASGETDSAAPKVQTESDPQPTTIVRLTPERAAYEVGERISVLVDILFAADVGHVPFHVGFDPGLLRFEYGEEGPFLSSDGNQSAFLAAGTNRGDTVVVGLSRLGRISGMSGDGGLCVLYFTAVGSGHATLRFSSATVRDSSNNAVSAAFQPTTVAIQ
jgi:hypothetical protein